MEEKNFFVGIYDPSDVRRNVLESSKEIVKSFQSSKNIKKIREDKLFLYDEMRNIMNELDMLIINLDKRMPKTHLRKTEISNPSDPNLEKLEKEIRNIEKEFYN
jgi:DNA repair protein RadC